MSNSEFSRSFAALLAAVGNDVETAVRKVTIEVYSALVLKSPVDTGRFRANWRVGDRAPNPTVTDAVDKSGNDAIVRGTAAIEAIELGGMIFLTNSLPYARRLEYGWSAQAPAGMIRITVMEYGQYLSRVVGGLRK